MTTITANLKIAETISLTEILKDNRIIDSAIEYIKLQAREINPVGTFDNAGRFYLDETFACCAVRQPSRSYPYSLMHHGRTLTHVAFKNDIYEYEDLIKRCVFIMRKYSFTTKADILNAIKA